jgi:hypothetical protein
MIYGTIVHIVDEGAEDPSVIVQPDNLRVHASDLEAAEKPESFLDKFSRVMNGPLGTIPQQWAANPGDRQLWNKMHELLQEIGILKPISNNQIKADSVEMREALDRARRRESD